MTDFMIREGRQVGKAKLAIAIERETRAIDRYLNGSSDPSSEQAYKLAVTCGCTPEEALALARKYSTDRAKETA